MANRENILKWTEALRSGEYPQTTDVLRDENGYCCLGVACEVALNNGVSMLVDTDGAGNALYDNEDVKLPDAVAEWLGLPSRYPKVRKPDFAWADGGPSYIELAELNDDYNDKIDFYGIASLIEKEFIGE